MLTSVAVELNDSFLLVGLFLKGSANGKDISIWVPFAAFDEHASVDQERFGVT